MLGIRSWPSYGVVTTVVGETGRLARGNRQAVPNRDQRDEKVDYRGQRGV